MTATALPNSRRRRRWLLVLILVVGLLVGVGVDIGLITARFQRYQVVNPVSAGPETWVIVGLDDRESADEQIWSQTGRPEDQPGTRADMIIVVTRMPDAIRGLSVPRNLVVGGVHDIGPGRERIGASWLVSPQRLVDVLCTQLKIPADHVISVDLQAVVTAVDALGGVEIVVPRALRDPQAGIDLPAGPQQLDGLTALGYVRSRSGQIELDGQWVAEPDGEQARRERQNQLIEAIMAKAKANPLAWQQLAWRSAPHIGLSAGTTLADLLPLRQLAGIQTMPTKSIAEGSLNQLDTSSQRAVAERGYASECKTG